MPTVMVRSGPKFINKRGETVDPVAALHICEDCKFEGASFGRKHGDQVLSYCGWVRGEPVCIGRGRDLFGAGR